MATRKPRNPERWVFNLDPDVGEYGIPTQCSLVADLRERYRGILKDAHVTSKTIAFTIIATDERPYWHTDSRTANWVKQFDNVPKGGLPPRMLAVTVKKQDAYKIEGPERHDRPFVERAPIFVNPENDTTESLPRRIPNPNPKPRRR